MSIVPVTRRPWDNGYPTSDGKPMAETDLHRDEMVDLIAMLREFFAGRRVYVSGNLLVFYVPGRRQRQVPGVHADRDGNHLPLGDPSTGQYPPTPRQRIEQAEGRAEQAEGRAEQAEGRAEQAEGRAEQAETEVARLRRLLE